VTSLAARGPRALRLAHVVDAVGRTPLLRLGRITEGLGDVEVWIKLEFMNPGGSVKDRAALQMIRDAERDGRLTPDKVLVDSTSGNTGVAYAMLGAALGYHVLLVMPENVTVARKNITKAYGCRIVYSDPLEGSDGSIRRVREIVASDPDRYFYPDQYSNPSNPLAHYLGTGAEIVEDVGERITHFVTGMGTTGTIMGVGRRLKEHRRDIRVIGVEPAEALHGLEGLKHMATSLVPSIYRRDEIDEILAVATDDGWDTADRLAAAEGIHVGHSTGANVSAALQVARRLTRGCVVTIACDRGDRYFAPMKWEKRHEW
jgi:cysteine synthase B